MSPPLDNLCLVINNVNHELLGYRRNNNYLIALYKYALWNEFGFSRPFGL